MKKVKLDVGEIVFVELPDGSNVQIDLKKNYLWNYLFTQLQKKKEIRNQPIIHMKNSNTFQVELRRGKNKKEMK